MSDQALKPPEIDRETARRGNLWSALKAGSPALTRFQLLAWMLLLPAAGGLALLLRMDGVAAVMGVGGLLASWRLLVGFKKAGKVKAWQRGLMGFGLPIHLAIMFLAALRLLGPVPGPWEQMEGTAGWTDPVIFGLSDGALVAITSGQEKRSHWLPQARGPWLSKDPPPRHGRKLAARRSPAQVIVAPAQGAELSIFEHASGSWHRQARPAGMLRDLFAHQEFTALALSTGLYTKGLAGDWKQVDGPRNCTGLAGSADGQSLFATGDMWLDSQDGGTSWKVIEGPAGSPEGARAGMGAGHRYAWSSSTWGGTLLLSKKGAAFEARKLPTRDVLCLLVNPDKGHEILVGSRSNGVWYSGVDGSSWIDLGLQGVEVRSLAVDWKAGRIWAASSNLMFKRGIYTRSLKKAW